MKMKTVMLLISLIAWLPQAKAESSNRGELVFKLCGQCHGTKGEGQPDIEAPAIAGLPAWYIEAQLAKFQNGARGAHPRDIPGMRMRPMARTLSPGDEKIIAAFVSNLPIQNAKPKMDGNPQAGQTHFQTCVACHGAQAEGNQATNAPPLKNSNDWYLYTQLKNFQNGLRGSNAEKDPNGATMSAMAKTLADDQSIKDVLAYIRSLP